VLSVPSVVKHFRPPLLILLAFAALCAAWLLSLDPRERFTTDVAELLPAGERDPEARLALSLVRERQARVVLVALDAPADTPAAALAATAQIFAASLRASPAFAAAEPLAGQTWQHALGRQLHARRFDLLLPAWLARSATTDPAALAASAVAALDEHLASPAASATADLLPSDPLLLLPSLADRASSLATAANPPPGRALIWAETAADPLTEPGQQPVFAALDAATAQARQTIPELAVRDTGVARFAAAAKASTKQEIGRLNLLAIAGVLLVSALFIRRLHGLLHLLPPVLLATLGAITVTTLVFPRVHLLVFALGSLLSGVAVDYGFHLILARRENESYRARLRRLTLPLLGGAGTTFAGFLLLTFSELPLVRQLGVYVAAGIASGLAATLLYLSLFPDLDLRPRAFRPVPALPHSLRLPVAAAIIALSVLGLTRVTWNDDLRLLEYPAPALRLNDDALRADFGQGDASATLLTRGATFAEARQRWENLHVSAPAHNPLSGVAALLPSPADYAQTTSPAARAALAAFPAAFRAAAEEAGYEDDAFAPFLRDFAAHLATPPPDYETLLRETTRALPGPFGLLVHDADDGVWFLSSQPRPVAAHDLPEGTVSLSGIEGLNTLFSRYRAAAARLSLLGCAALVVIACALHGPRFGLRTAALPLLAAATAFALLALRAEPFGLFHLLGALLGVCLADDYAHFAAAENESRAAIRLSALTTAASFAVLATSAIPAVSALGATVTLIVALALLFVETDLFSLRHA
jgi:predicted exporter